MQNPRRRRSSRARMSPVRSLISNIQKSIDELEERLEAVEEEVYDREEYDFEFEIEEDTAIGVGSSCNTTCQSQPLTPGTPEYDAVVAQQAQKQAELNAQLLTFLNAQACANAACCNVGAGSTAPSSIGCVGLGSSAPAGDTSSADTCSFCGSYCGCCSC